MASSQEGLYFKGNSEHSSLGLSAGKQQWARPAKYCCCPTTAQTLGRLRAEFIMRPVTVISGLGPKNSWCMQKKPLIPFLTSLAASSEAVQHDIIGGDLQEWLFGGHYSCWETCLCEQNSTLPLLLITLHMALPSRSLEKQLILIKKFQLEKQEHTNYFTLKGKGSPCV